MTDAIGPGLPPPPPFEDDIQDPETEKDVADDSGNPNQEVEETKSEREVATRKIEAKLLGEKPEEASNEHPRAGYGRIPRIEIFDDTVRQSARRLAIAAGVLIAVAIGIAIFSALATTFVVRTTTLPNVIESEISEPLALADGQYTMSPTTFLVGDGKCLFAGVVTLPSGTPNEPQSASVVVAGSSLAECGMDASGTQREEASPADTVVFVVTNGKASILRLEQETASGTVPSPEASG